VNTHTNSVSPALSTSRICKAIWNMLSQEGYRTHVINWFASHPPEKINGICISELYSTMPKKWDRPWKLGKDIVHPQSLHDLFEELRLHPAELEGQLLQMFAKDIHELDIEKDRRVMALANLVAEAFSIHNATTHILENEDWDFLAVYYGCIDHFCHGFMHYHPPQMPGISDDDFRIFKDVIPNVCRLHDRMLARLIQLAGPDTHVIVCSDHGFHSDHLRPPGTPAIPAGPAVWHRDQGMILMQGPKFQQDELIHGANLLDITPTILQLFDLPIGHDMDGRPLAEAFQSPGNLQMIPSWEQRSGEHPDGMHDRGAKMSDDESQALLDQFVALGYVDPPSEDEDKAVADTYREMNWNLARALIDGGQVGPAVEILEKLVKDYPERRDYTLALAKCLAMIGLEEEGLALKLAVFAGQETDSFNAAIARGELAATRGDWKLAVQHLESIELDQFDFTAAGSLSLVSRWMILGMSYFKLQEWERASTCYLKALEIDEDYPLAWLGLARCLNRMGQHERALEAALSAVELEHHLMQAHYAVGMSLAKTQRYERAVGAFKAVLRYAPGNINAHKRLAAVYARLGDYPELAERHRAEAERLLALSSQSASVETSEQIDAFRKRVMAMAERLRPFYVELAEREKKEAEERRAKMEAQAGQEQAERKEFIVVSGLPRSGTSLMMQMLQAAGLEPMTDGKRAADEDNPEGYLEWDEIKQIKARPELMERAEGKATKVISMLLPGLPRQHNYKIIFVTRPIEEIVASQQKMIQRLGTEGADLDAETLGKSLKRHRKEIMNLLSKMPAQVMAVNYHQILENPDRIALRVASFVGTDLLPRPEDMASVVRTDLYRNRMNNPQDVAGHAAGESGD
ncbi:MAG: tetratricopeptide repeat protein, partial [Pirellulaceae bacterium]